MNFPNVLSHSFEFHQIIWNPCYLPYNPDIYNHYIYKHPQTYPQNHTPNSSHVPIPFNPYSTWSRIPKPPSQSSQSTQAPNEGFHSHGGTPVHHPCRTMGFSLVNPSFWDTPMAFMAMESPKSSTSSKRRVFRSSSSKNSTFSRARCSSSARSASWSLTRRVGEKMILGV